MFTRRKIPAYMILEQPRPRVNLWWRWFRIFFVLFLASVVVLLVFATRAAAADTMEEVGSGELLLQTQGGGYSSAVQLQSTVHFQISGLVAHVRLQQRFRNDSEGWVEGVYVFPLPDEAAVNQLRLVIGERVIVGEIHEREEAKKVYQQAKQAGKKASLVEQQRPNMFTNRVANIGPGEEISVELEYIQRIDYRDGMFSLRFPMTITPRYIPGRPLVRESAENYQMGTALGWAKPTDQVPDAHAITPPLSKPAGIPDTLENTVEISAEIDAGLPLAAVEAPFHDIKLTRSGHRYQLQLAQSRVPMDRDFVLQWRPQLGSEPQVAVFRELLDGEEYALLMVLPPQTGSGPVLPREVVFVIDSSGSMGGTSIVQARQSLQFGLSLLGPDDYFNIIEFNSSARALFHASLPANNHNLARAREFVRHLDAGGGTEMMSALQMALYDPDESVLLRQVVFITDGAVGNEVALFREIEARIGRSRLFTVGIGAAPNSWFMRKAAQFGRGQFTFIGDLSQLQQRMQALFDSLSQPLATDISVDWSQGVESWPQAVPDLYRGEPLVLVAKMSEPGRTGSITVTGRTAQQQWRRQVQVQAISRVPGAHPGVATLWARQKIGNLLDGKILGVDEQDVRASVLPVALAHRLVSPYTSFVAVEQLRSRPPGADVHAKAVANLPPAGQSQQPYAWPRTASGAHGQLLLGLGLLLMSLLLYCLFNSERDSSLQVFS